MGVKKKGPVQFRGGPMCVIYLDGEWVGPTNLFIYLYITVNFISTKNNKDYKQGIQRNLAKTQTEREKTKKKKTLDIKLNRRA